MIPNLRRYPQTLTWPASWVWLGGTAPPNIAANKRALLQLWSEGTTETAVRARWLVES